MVQLPLLWQLESTNSVFWFLNLESGFNPLPPQKELIYIIVRGRKGGMDGKKEGDKEKDPSNFLVYFYVCLLADLESQLKNNILTK